MLGSISNLTKVTMMKNSTNQRRGKSLLNSKLSTIVLVASMMIEVAGAVECYWCSGVGPDRRCERTPQNNTGASISVKCPMRYCITTKVINAVNGEVESFARNCDNTPHGNTCIKDTHLITCFQTCTTDLCNSGNPDPAHLGMSTQGGQNYDTKNHQLSKEVIQGVRSHDSPLARVAQRAQAMNAVMGENGKVGHMMKEKIVPYKSKLGRYVVYGNTVRFLTTTPRHWWVTDSSTTKANAVNSINYDSNDVDSKSLSAAAAADASSREVTRKVSDAPQSPRQSTSSGSARDVTSAEQSRHSFDYLGYAPSKKPKPTTAAPVSRKWFSESSAPSAGSTLKSKKMWYEQSDSTAPNGTGTNSPTTITSVSKDNSQVVLTQNVLNKPSRPTLPTKRSSNVSENQKKVVKKSSDAPKDQNQFAKETVEPVTKSKNDYSKSTEVADLLPILEALITDGYITLNEDKLSSSRVTTTTTTETPTQRPTYGLLEAANVFTSHVHGKTNTQRPIHQTVNRRYKKKLVRDQNGGIRPAQRKTNPNLKLVPEPYIVSFLNRGREVNSTHQAAAPGLDNPMAKSAMSESMTTEPMTSSKITRPDVTFKMQEPAVTSKNVMLSETSKRPESVVTSRIDSLDVTKDAQYESTTRKTTMLAETSTDKNINTFWQKLSNVSKKAKSGISTLNSGIPNQLKTITPVPTDLNSLTVTASSDIDLQKTSPSKKLVDSANKLINLDSGDSKVESSSANTKVEKSSIPEIHASPSSGKPQATPEVKYISVYPKEKKAYNSNKKVKTDGTRSQSSTISIDSKLTSSEPATNSEMSDFDNLVDDLSIRKDGNSGMKKDFSDSDNTFTILTESKKNSQRSKLYSASLTNADYLNEINRKIGEKLQSVEEESTKDYSELHASTRAVTTTRSDMVSKTEATILSDTPKPVAVLASAPGNFSEETARKDAATATRIETTPGKEVPLLSDVTDKPAQTNQITGSTPKIISSGNSVSSSPSSGDSGRQTETDENLFRTTGVNADFTFRASVWTDSAADSIKTSGYLPDVKITKDNDLVSVNIQQSDIFDKNANVEDTLIQKSDRKLVAYEITLGPTSSNLQRSMNVSDTKNSSVQVIFSKADEAEISIVEKSSEALSPSTSSSVSEKLSGTTLPPTGENKDNSVILAYEDTMNEILKTVRGTASPAVRGAASPAVRGAASPAVRGAQSPGLSSRSTQAPTIFIKPAVHVPGKIAKLEGKKRLFSSRRVNSSCSIYSFVKFWHLFLVMFITATRF